MDAGANKARARISADGTCSNGVHVATLVRFIRSYECEARIDDVADYFHLGPADVAAALDFYAANFERIYPLVRAGE